MFGLGFGEILILLIVGIVVVGPKNLPTLMRTTGRWISKLRRMSTDLRAQSGIDDLIRHEGLEGEIRELRSLSRVNVMDSIMGPAALAAATPAARAALPAAQSSAPRPVVARTPMREREYPLIGCDAYGALPDDAAPYVEPAPEADVAPPPVDPATPDASGAPEAAADAGPPAAPEAPALSSVPTAHATNGAAAGKP